MDEIRKRVSSPLRLQRWKPSLVTRLFNRITNILTDLFWSIFLNFLKWFLKTRREILRRCNENTRFWPRPSISTAKVRNHASPKISCHSLLFCETSVNLIFWKCSWFFFSSCRIFYIHFKLYNWPMPLRENKIESGIWKHRDGKTWFRALADITFSIRKIPNLKLDSNAIRSEREFIGSGVSATGMKTKWRRVGSVRARGERGRGFLQQKPPNSKRNPRVCTRFSPGARRRPGVQGWLMLRKNLLTTIAILGRIRGFYLTRGGDPGSRMIDAVHGGAARRGRSSTMRRDTSGRIVVGNVDKSRGFLV